MQRAGETIRERLQSEVDSRRSAPSDLLQLALTSFWAAVEHPVDPSDDDSYDGLFYELTRGREPEHRPTQAVCALTLRHFGYDEGGYADEASAELQLVGTPEAQLTPLDGFRELEPGPQRAADVAEFRALIEQELLPAITASECPFDSLTVVCTSD